MSVFLALVLGIVGVVLVSASASSPAAASEAGAGTVAAFGANAYGQLGDGTKTDRHVPTKVVGLDGVRAVAGGSVFSLAVRSDGTVWAWGRNDLGQLGDGTTTDRVVPVQVKRADDGTPLGGVVMVAGGRNHSLALRADGTVWAWGDNGCGELGNSGGDSSTAVKVEGLTGVRGIAAGGGDNSYGHSLAVTNEGKVYAWGENESGQLGNGTIDHTPVTGGGCRPIHASPSLVSLPAGTKAVGVAVGGPANARGTGTTYHGGHDLAVTDDGKVYAWGDNTYGQLGVPPSGESPVPVQVMGLDGKKVTSVAAGGLHSLAVLDDGSLYAWGNNENGQLGTGTAAPASSVPTQVGGVSGVRQVAAGYTHTLVVTQDGRVLAWGAMKAAASTFQAPYDGQTGPAASATPVEVTGFVGPVSAIAGGAYHSLAVGGAAVPARPANVTRPSFTGEAQERQTLTGDHGTWSGSDVTFSYQWRRCASDGSGCQDIAGASDLDYTLQTADVGSRVKLVVTASNGGGSATAESDLSAEVAPAPPPPAGGHVAVGFGFNGLGQIGDGTVTDRHFPAGVVGLTGVTALDAGQYHSLALRSDGSVWGWGSNGAGQLGDGTKDDRSVPVRVKLNGTFTAVSAGATHNLALRADGSVWGWGNNTCGELGNAGGAISVTKPVKVTGLTGPDGSPLRITALAAGNTFSLAVTKEGKVYSWGINSSGQLGNGTVDAGGGSCRHEVPGAVSFPAATRPVVAVAAGASHSLAVSDDGKVYSWGDDTYGQLGRPNSGPSPTAQQVTGLGPAVIVGVAAGANHSLARTRDGILYAWGNNRNGQLGTGDAAPQSFLPSPVAGIRDVKDLAGGGDHSVALRSDGTVWAWGAVKFTNSFGDPYYGQTGSAPSATPVVVRRADGTPFDKAVMVAAGGSHSLAAVAGDQAPPPPPPPPSCAGSGAASATRAAGAASSSGGTSGPRQGLRSSGASTRAAAASTATDDPWVQQPTQFGLAPSTFGVSGGAMAYDAKRRKVVFFSAPTGTIVSGGVQVNETWTWDGSTSTWTKEAPVTSPSVRFGVALAYDPVSERVVLFGGVSNGEVLNDTWTWDGSTWTKEAAATSPPLRWGAAMADGPGRGSPVLFGGSQTQNSSNGANLALNPALSNEAMLCDTWSWDGRARTWVEKHPATTPPARRSGSMAFHAATGSDVLFGGTAPGTPRMGDTWAWDGSDWTPRSSDQSPVPRFGAGLASLPDVGAVVLFGGDADRHPEGASTETWTWDGQAWTHRLPGQSPSAGGPMAYDGPGQRVMLLTAGANGGGFTPSETWTWDGKQSSDSIDTTPRVKLELDPSSITADGVSHSKATVTVTVGHNPFSGARVRFRTSGDVTFGAVTDHGDGTYTTEITSSATADKEVIETFANVGVDDVPASHDVGSAHAELTETAGEAPSCSDSGGGGGAAPQWTDLDRSFGCFGIARTRTGRSPDNLGRQMKLQPDGKILMAGGHRLARYQPDGSLDEHFGSHGIVSDDDRESFLIALQSDGKIVVFGSGYLRRLNSDGTPDESFGDGGFAAVPLQSTTRAIEVDHQERIVVLAQGGAGTGTGGELITGVIDTGVGYVAGANTMVLARYSPDGKPDASFGANGTAQVRFPPGTLGYPADLAVEPDGAPVVAGALSTGTAGGNSPPGAPDSRRTSAFAYRLRPNGDVDTTFNACGVSAPPPTCGGIATTDFAPAQGTAGRVVVQGDGKILLAGGGGGDSTDPTNDSGIGFALARYNADGTTDTSFNACAQPPTQPCGGKIVGPTHFPGFDGRRSTRPVFGPPDAGWFTDATVQPADGRIVVAGHGPYLPGDFLVARYNPDGTLEDCGSPSFARTKVAFDGTPGLPGAGVAVQPDGKILAGGWYTGDDSSNDGGFALVRYRGGGGPGPCAGPGPGVSISDAPAVTEPAKGTVSSTFTVTLRRPASLIPLSLPARVDYATHDGSAKAGKDYQATSGTLTFASDETTKTITVPVLADSDPNEATEHFTVRLSKPGDTTIADGEGTGTINDPSSGQGTGDKPPGGGGTPTPKPPGGNNPSGQPPGVGPGSGPCVTSPGFASVSGRGNGGGLELRFSRLSGSPVLVEVFESTVGSRAIGARRVAVFRDRSETVAWNGRTGRGQKVPDGYYWVRYRIVGQNGRADVRREAYVRRHGKFSRLPEFSRSDNLCGLLDSFGLSAPAFGGPTNRALKAAFHLVARGDVTLQLVRGRRVLRTVTLRGVVARRTYTVGFSARHRRRGSYQVRILARSGKLSARDTLTSRRL